MSEKPENWTKSRWKELKSLERLLIECDSINSANNITSRLERIIKMAEKLRESSYGHRRKSFFHFLQDHAVYEVRRKMTKEPKQSQKAALAKGGKADD